MGTKTIAVSTDGTTYYTLPGNTGDLKGTMGQIKDTIFGQNFESNQVGINSWQITANGLWKGFAGYVARVLKQGTSTAFTTIAMTQVGATKQYRATSSVYSIWDPNGVFHVFDGGTNQDANVQSYDYLTGAVTFKSTYTPAGAITVTGSYFPTTVLGTADKFTLKQQVSALLQSTFQNVQANGGFDVYSAGLIKVSLDISGFYSVTSALRTLLNARTNLIIEIDPSGQELSYARGIYKCVSEAQAGAVGALETETTSFALQVPSSNYLPFEWFHASNTTLSMAVQICLNALLGGTLIYVKYLYDGTNGASGQAIVTDASLSSGLTNMNEFAFTFQGSGATTDVGTG